MDTRPTAIENAQAILGYLGSLKDPLYESLDEFFRLAVAQESLSRLGFEVPVARANFALSQRRRDQGIADGMVLGLDFDGVILSSKGALDWDIYSGAENLYGDDPEIFLHTPEHLKGVLTLYSKEHSDLRENLLRLAALGSASREAELISRQTPVARRSSIAPRL